MNRFLRFPEVKAITGLSRTTLWRLARRGLFPKRKQISSNSVAWDAMSISEWMENRPEGMAPPPAEALKKRSTTSHADGRDEHRPT